MRRFGPAASSERLDGHHPDLADEDGMRAAYEAHGAELYRFAARRLRDATQAQDVVQEVFVRAWRHADRFDPDIATLRVWLFGIARHVVVDRTRHMRARPDVPVAQEDLHEMAGSEPDFDDGILTTHLMEEALQALSDQHRAALTETYLRGRTYAEVAAEEAIPVGTLRSRVFYALKALRWQIDEMGVEL
jgi:RNA polymerase sigma-70 factor, ECF subfamily